MSPEESDAAYLWDMLDAAQTGIDMISGRSFDDFAADPTARLAMERQRNIVAHEYGRIDHTQLFRTALEDLPRLVGLLRSMLPPAEPAR